jgi:hypothetical protein
LRSIAVAEPTQKDFKAGLPRGGWKLVGHLLMITTAAVWYLRGPHCGALWLFQD